MYSTYFLILSPRYFKKKQAWNFDSALDTASLYC